MVQKLLVLPIAGINFRFFDEFREMEPPESRKLRTSIASANLVIPAFNRPTKLIREGNDQDGLLFYN